MTRKSILVLLFIALVVFQLYTLLQWINKAETTRKEGVYLKIPCHQVDPIDPFRGTYLNINVDPSFIESPDSLLFSESQDVWINYTCDNSNNCAYLSIQPGTETPLTQKAIKCSITKVYHYLNEKGQTISQVYIQYPFSKYYINENKALIISQKYNQALVDSTIHVYAGVFVSNGNAVLDAIWLGNEKLE
ncbi:MAG: GDYXXLXY domain-containing protein [Saprospiraceae bacterium]